MVENWHVIKRKQNISPTSWKQNSKLSSVAWANGGGLPGPYDCPLVAGMCYPQAIEGKLFIPRLVLPLKAARTSGLRGPHRAAHSQQMWQFLCLRWGLRGLRCLAPLRQPWEKESWPQSPSKADRSFIPLLHGLPSAENVTQESYPSLVPQLHLFSRTLLFSTKPCRFPPGSAIDLSQAGGYVPKAGSLLLELYLLLSNS